MELHLPPDPGDRGEPDVRLGRVDGGTGGAERRLIRDGAQVLAHGALVCPSCALPLHPAGAVPFGGQLRCGFCDHLGEAAGFVRRDVYDTVANEVYVVARIT
jgi:hypothetical protein